MNNTQNKTIVFYDGECGICHTLVRFVLMRDTNQKFLFAPQQGETFAKQFSEHTPPLNGDTIIIVDKEGNKLTHADATIELLKALPGIWPTIARIFQLIPKPLRDTTYRLFARHRRRFFGSTRDYCPVVREPLRRRFLP